MKMAEDLGAEQIRDDAARKLRRLKEILESFGSALIAFSGGLDSSFLLKVAHDTLGDKAVAFTVASPLTPEEERNQAEKLAGEIGVRHFVENINTLKDPHVRANPRDRCYHCKKIIYREGLSLAGNLNIKVFADGTTAEDMRSGRPGLRAIQELGVKTPLAEAGFVRSDIIHHSRLMGLPTWNKPSQSCLATRVPYDTPLDEGALRKLEKIERVAAGKGFTQVRARLHGNVIRLEVPAGELPVMAEPAVRLAIVKAARELGFPYITLDLEGFVSGSMDRV